MSDTPSPDANQNEPDAPNPWRTGDDDEPTASPIPKTSWPTQSGTPTVSYDYARAGARLWASSTDIVLGAMVFGGIWIASPDVADYVRDFLPVAIFLIVFAMTALWGATPGKMILGLRVIDAGGPIRRPSVVAACLRSVISTVQLTPMAPIFRAVVVIASIVLISNDRERRSLSDLLGATRVVKRTQHLDPW